MELRSAEEQVQEILTEYQSLCKTEDALVEISSSQEEVEEAPSSTDDLDAGQVLSALESLHERLDALLPKMDRFRKRLGEVRETMKCLCIMHSLCVSDCSCAHYSYRRTPLRRHLDMENKPWLE